MDSVKNNAKNRILPKGVKDLYRLTPMQEGMLYVNMSGDATSYLIQNFFRIGKRPEKEKIREATELIILRHELLRTNILLMSKGAFQIVTDKKLDYEYYDLTGLNEAVQNERMNQIAGNEVKRGFDLQKDMLIRIRCFQLDSENMMCLWTYHHLIMDGWSLQNIINDFVRYYTMLFDGVDFEQLKSIVKVECDSLPRFKDFVEWTNAQDKNMALTYWKELLDGYESVAEIKPISIPNSVDLPVVRTGMLIDKEIYGRIKSIFKNISLDTFLKTIWGITLQKYTLTEDVVFAEVVSGRNAEIDNIEQMVGMLINVVPVRVSSEVGCTFRELLNNMSDQHNNSFANSFVPLSEIQMLTSQKNELIKTLFVCENVTVIKEDADAVISFVCERVREQTNYGLSVICSIENDEIRFDLLYDPKKYGENEIAFMLNKICNIIKQVVCDADILVSDIKMICEEEINLILNCFNTVNEYQKNMTVAQMFERIVNEFPDLNAVYHNGKTLTYRQLNEQANCIAHYIRSRGIKPGDLIAISTEKSLEMIIGILGIIKSGSAFLPIDPIYPVKRIEYMIQDSAPKLFIKYRVNIKSAIPCLDLELFEYQTKNHRNPDLINNIEDLLYCIYTSGTTGNPKGVLVANRGIPNLRNYFKNQQFVSEKDRVLQFASMSFDAMISEITMSLFTGASLYILPEEVRYDGGLLEKYILDHDITIAILPPLLLNQIHVEGLRTVITAGSETNKEIVNNNSHIEIYSNDYGPTEGTVCATYWRHRSGDYVPERIPIGKPIANSSVYIMNGNHLCGIGVLGEICIGGVGVAKGYLNKPEYTAEKFISNPYGEGMLYRTGDIGRWLEDGNIEFFGRKDEQVKIRGFRIELSEIENALREFEEIKDAVAITKENQEGDKLISAYYVAEKELSIEILRSSLINKLPDYMIPSIMARIETIPLTQNGKVDKKALPKIHISSDKEYIEPRTAVEKALCAAFIEVLGVEKVGIRDGFFELGGDSIKAIRIISKMRSYGYELTVRDIMNKYTVEAISNEVTKKSAIKYSSDEISGDIVLTPMLQHFMRWQLEYPERFTQNVLLKTEIDDDKVIRNALGALAEHHDMLRCVCRNEKVFIQKLNESILFDFCIKDFRSETNQEELMEEKCAKELKSFNLENGPLMKAILFRLSDGNRLFICIHHICIDSVSWHILLEDLQSAMKQAKNSTKIRLNDKTTSFQEWAQMLANYTTQISDKEKCYWKEILNHSKDALFKTTAGDSRGKIINAELDEQRTKMLLRNTSRAYNTEINDLLLCALGMAVKKTTGQNNILIGLEGHGREDIKKDIAVDRTIGWFTSKYPVIVKCDGDIRNNIIETKEMLRAIPMHGIGYGLLRNGFDGLEECIGFNYLGETDTHNNGKILFNISGRRGLHENVITSLLDINCYIERGKFRLNCTINTARTNKTDAQFLINSYIESLSSIIDHCSTKNQMEKTISDYSASTLTIEELNKIYKKVSSNEAEDIYELAPLQEGMLYHAVADNKSTAYIIQHMFKIDGSIKLDTIKESIRLLALKHEVLRTCILYRETNKPWQIIVKNSKIDYELVKMDGFDEEYQVTECMALAESEVRRGFDLEEDSLLRVKCISLGERGWRLIWSYHHIIIDGWCSSVLFGDFLEYCSIIEKGMQISVIENDIVTGKKNRGRYADYVKWFKKDNSNILSYWKEYLSGYEEITEIQPMYKPRLLKSQIDRNSITMKDEIFDKIKNLLIDLKITLNTVIETAVGIMLQQYNYTQDVVFGKVVSGRNAEIKDIENIVGLFVNTIPLRVVTERNETVAALLGKMQLNGIKSVENSRCSLSEIQGIIKRNGELIKVLYAFENYYMNEKRMDTYGFEMEYTREQTNYTITITSYVKNNELILGVLYDPCKFRENEILLILERISHVIEWMCENKEAYVDEVEAITKKERKLILGEFNDTLMEYPSDMTIIELFEKQVITTPDCVAITDQDRTLSYNLMNKKVNQLAVRLRELGVRPGDFVAIISERSMEMVIGIYAILKSGGAYVPIDPDYPEHRMKYILNDCSPKAILVCGRKYVSEVPVIDLTDENTWSGSEDNLPIVNQAKDLAYMIYTSGTTGNPKGVLLEHHGVVAMNSYLKDLYKVGTGERILQYANYVFDASVWEMTMAFLNGATLVMIDLATIADAHLFEKFILDNKITVMLLPPQMFLQHRNLKCKILTTGGSASNEEVVKKTELCNRYINAYGPTENTVLATHWEKGKDNLIYNSIPIGKPIKNTRIYVMNHNQLCGIGVLGELCIAGEGLARGYHNRPDLTNEKFVYNNLIGERVYHSGDLVRWLPDGNIDFLGRIDEQVKIHGYRIELGEIESLIRAMNDIKDVTVSTFKIAHDMKLCVYYVTNKDIEGCSIKIEIEKFLPSYMVPSDYIKLEYIPYTSSGKVDKRKLPIPDMKHIRERTQYVVAKNQFENDILFIWNQILNNEMIGTRDNFFDLGGNSLLVMSMQLKINEKYSNVVKVTDIFNNPTIEALARFIATKSNCVNCEEMPFKEGYFRTIEETNKSKKISRRFSQVASDKLIKMHQIDDKNLHSLLLFVYAYVLHEETECNDLSIMHFFRNEISAFKVSVTLSGDLNEFRNNIWYEYEQHISALHDTIGITQKANSLSVAFFYLPDSECETSKNLFDFTISFSMVEGIPYIETEIFSNRTSYNGICSFLENFIDVIERILDEMK